MGGGLPRRRIIRILIELVMLITCCVLLCLSSEDSPRPAPKAASPALTKDELAAQRSKMLKSMSANSWFARFDETMERVIPMVESKLKDSELKKASGTPRQNKDALRAETPMSRPDSKMSKS